MTTKGTRDYRVNYFYAHPVGQPDAASVTGVQVNAHRDIAFLRAEEVIAQGKRHDIPCGAEVVHIDPTTGQRSVLRFYGERVTTATYWHVELLNADETEPHGKIVCGMYGAERNEEIAREDASDYVRRNPTGTAKVYRMVKGKAELVATITGPTVAEIDEATKINDAMIARDAADTVERAASRTATHATAAQLEQATKLAAAMCVEPTPEAIGWVIEYQYRNLDGTVFKSNRLSGLTLEVTARLAAIRIQKRGGFATLIAVMPDGRRSVRSYYETRSATLDEIKEAHAMNALALLPFPNADHLIGERVTLTSADRRQSTGTITGTIARVRPAPLGSTHTVAELASGYLVDLPASLVEATAPRNGSTPSSPGIWARDTEPSPGLAGTLRRAATAKAI